MLYLMAVLTFLAGILFYTFSPREDRLSMDVFPGEAFIQSFLSQHQAAKNYLRRWYGVNRPAEKVFNLDDRDIFRYLDRTLEHEMCDHSATTDPLQDDEAPCFLSRVVCTNSDGTNSVECNTSTDLYLVTYGGLTADGERPSWWPRESTSRPRRYERWRRAFAQRTTGSMTCGTVFEDPNNADHYCLDNGEKSVRDTACIKPIPAGVFNELYPSASQRQNALDMFFCMSKIKQGPLSYYPQNLVKFWDGLDNQNMHAPNYTTPQTRLSGNADGRWIDLVESSEAAQWNLNPVTKVYGFENLDKSFFGEEGKEKFPALILRSPDLDPTREVKNSEIDFNLISGAFTQDFTLTLLVGFDSDKETASPKKPNVQLAHFKNGSGASWDITMQSDTDKKIRLYLNFIGPDDGTGHHNTYIFKADYSDPDENGSANFVLSNKLVHTFTLRRKGTRLSMYVGKYIKDQPLLDEEAHLITEIFDSFTSSGQEKMQTITNGLNQKTYLYGVRFYNRALTTDEIYDMYKEDSRRFPMYEATSYVDGAWE